MDMPELPEIFNLAKQMNSELRGKLITGVEVRQPKCLNISPARICGTPPLWGPSL